MAEDEPKPPEAENEEQLDEPPGDDGDYALGTLVRLANAGGVSMGVTLFVGGSIVTGLLIGAVQYHEGVAKMLDEVGENAEWLAQMHRAQAETLREQFGDDFTKAFEAPYRLSFIHLKDAKAYTPGLDPLPTGQGFWWRGRMDRVDGFFIGELGPPGARLQPPE